MPTERATLDADAAAVDVSDGHTPPLGRPLPASQPELQSAPPPATTLEERAAEGGAAAAVAKPARFSSGKMPSLKNLLGKRVAK